MLNKVINMAHINYLTNSMSHLCMKDNSLKLYIPNMEIYIIHK